MGYNTTATTQSLVAKLTPLGRQLMVSTNTGLITGFSLGDSDANYNAVIPLSTGQVPTESGNVGPNSSVSNSTTQIASIRSFLIVNSGVSSLVKPVESQSSQLSADIISNGTQTISGTNISTNIVDRNNYITDSLVNLFYSFGLPLSLNDDILYTGRTYVDGGYSDTALSGLAQSKIVVVAINNSTYGESLDGRQIKLVLPTSAVTSGYTIYSTFQNKGGSLRVEDANLRDTSPVTANIGTNIAFLFSDNIQKPNGDVNLTWSSGFGTVKPFSNNAKRLYNLQTNTSQAITADTLVGVAYLDKGFLVITNPTIVNQYDTLYSGNTGTTITFNNVSTDVYQNVICIANRGEFGDSTNRTFEVDDVPRISEVGLYDINGNLIALAKPDRHIEKSINEFITLGVRISL
jgi:hypothetical protein